jgi:hypothetical protein
MRSNPFFELYVGDRISSADFVKIFSDFLVEHAESLFLAGHVVVTGVQGSGKSMLLSLLKPDVRLRYINAGVDFPVKRNLRRFIGAGINLAHSNAIDFGYRTLPGDAVEASILFGDFVNYTIARDLIRSVEAFGQAGSQITAEAGVNLSKPVLDQFLDGLVRDDAWQGYLTGCRTLLEVVERLEQRTSSYRSFLHMNTTELPTEIRETKSAIGVPISRMVVHMKSAGVLDSDVNVFVHVDQYEELANLEADASPGIDYRAVINRALARRDPFLSYRIGSRTHAWDEHGRIFGTTAKLEEAREYKYFALDELLRRHENRKTWIFPAFAADVFARRLSFAGLTPSTRDSQDLLRDVFGPGLTADEKGRRYAGQNRTRSVRVDDDWPEDVKQLLLRLAEADPLSARLGEAWILQKGFEGVDAAPWNSPARQYWKKERIDLALIQIAGRCMQRPIFSGHEEIIDLSGGNILIFLSICQFIWDAQLQSEAERPEARGVLRTNLSPDVQALGIFKASDYWLKKIPQETGRSAERLRFVREFGTRVSRELFSDRKLSNPGHNGFSLADSEVEMFPKVKTILQDLSDYGAVSQLAHTTKERDRRVRHKFYLNPILCPAFRIPYKRLKEPRYLSATEFRDWLINFRILNETPSSNTRIPTQVTAEELPLFRNG